jgi:hypothetical protein
MNKKFLFFQCVIIALILFFVWKDWIGAAIGLGIIELLILYGRFRTKEENQYVLPATVAKSMKTAPEQLAHEMTILSTFLLILGSIGFAVYTIIYSPYAWLMKIFVVFNSLCIVIFMGAQLMTSYRQYNSLMEMQKLLKEMEMQDVTVENKVKGGKINNGQKSKND